MNSKWHRWALLAVSVCACTGPVEMKSDSSVTKAAPSMDAEARELALESFDYVWQTILDKHWDPERLGDDWEQARTELRPEVQSAKSEGRVREILAELLDRLGESHFSIVPAAAYRDLEPEEETRDSESAASEENAVVGETSRRRAGSGSLGIEVRVLEDEAVIVSVHRDSTAAAHGLRTGLRILEIDGTNLTPIFERIRSADPGVYLEIVLTSAVVSRLGGREGEEVELRVADGAGVERTLKVPLGEARGRLTKLGHLPATRVTFDSQRIAGDVGYIAFNAFMDPMFLARSFGEAVGEFMDCAGIVIDLRGNPGGVGMMVGGMAGWFLEDTGLDMGTMKTRTMNLRFFVNPRAETFTGKLVVLVDGASCSTAEIFAQGLKDLGRARIIGTRTAGAALPSTFERLPNGDRFQYALADFVSPTGIRIEGVGVEPHDIVKLSRPSLLAGRDNVVDSAVNWIHGPTGP